jgi:hypothetical protein
MNSVTAAARAFVAAIRAVDPLDDDRALLVRRALVEILDAVREQVGDEWETIVLLQLGRLLSSVT